MATFRDRPLSDAEQKLLCLAEERGGVAGRSVAMGAAPEPEPAPVFADEAAFMAAIVQQAKVWGFVVYHTHDSRRSEPGFPDLLMIRRDRLLVWELKRSRREKPTAAQRRWLRLFQGIPGAEVRIFSPEDWSEILKELS